jgi:hypothetical protein
LTSSRLTPKQQDHLAHLGSWMPFDRARAMLETLLGVQVSEPSVRRGTEQAGGRYEARQTAQSRQEEANDSAVSSAEKLVVSIDGAYVPLVGGEWAEVRTVAVGEVQTESPRASEEAHTRHLSSFARMTDAETFGEVAEVEMRRRGVSQAQAVCAVTDGAPWIQGFLDLHRPDAIRILDFPHAAEHLGRLIEALTQAGVPLPARVLERSLPVLKHRGPTLLLRWCERLPDAIKALEAVQKQLDYFRKRLGLMHYPTYQRDGWPIGSGMVESANKLVVQARLKGAGMHWQPEHVNAMLALRSAVCSERWDEAWHEVVEEEQAQRTASRRERATSRFEAQLASLLPLLLSFSPPTPTPAPPSPSPTSRLREPAATLPGSSRPSAHHPWKRSPACRPKLSAKK